MRRGGCSLLLKGALLSLLSTTPAFADKTRPTAQLTWTGVRPQIDGHLNEPVWKTAPEYGGFLERRPKLNQEPPVKTTFRVLFDAQAIYFAVYCFDDQPVRARTKARDNFAMFRDDAISIKLDPAHDHRTTLGFVLNPATARMDYRGINESEFRAEFDAVWQGAASVHKDGWTAEFRIPYTALNIDPKDPPPKLGLNLSRDHARRNATYDWTVIAPPFSPIAASRYGHLVGLGELARRAPSAAATKNTGTKRSFAIVPYLLGGFRLNREEGNPNIVSDGEHEAGIDAFVSLGKSWRGQITINTDFAQVDLDDQVVNLTRFGVFFPESATFFFGMRSCSHSVALGRPRCFKPAHWAL